MRSMYKIGGPNPVRGLYGLTTSGHYIIIIIKFIIMIRSLRLK